MSKHSYQFAATGTTWQIDFTSNADESQITALKEQIDHTVRLFESTYSRFDSNSLVSKLARTSGEFTLPPTAKPLFDLYTKLYRITSGVFTPCIGQTLVEAGYDANYSLTPKTLTTPPPWTDIIYDDTSISISKPIQLDFGAAGKGYLIDLVSDILTQQSISEYCIDAGGDIKISADSPLSIGLEHPTQAGQVIGQVQLSNTSICGSSGNRRHWANMHHIISPTDLVSPSSILATWAVCPNTAVADALATSLFLVDPAILTSHFDFEYLIIYHDLTYTKSANFPGSLYT